MNNRFQKKLLAGCIAVILTGCGGDSGTSDPNQSVDTGGPAGSTPQAVRALGEIDGFGSVIVNGVHYETDDAAFMVDGEPATENELEVGQIVELMGEIDAEGNAKATKVFMRTRVAGEISALDVEARTLTVLDYTVNITDDTKLDRSINEVTLEGLAEGVYVKVHGVNEDDGSITASRIGLKRVPQMPEMRDKDHRVFGEVESVDTDAKTLVVEGKTIDFSSATVRGDVDGLVAGAKVMARGTDVEGTLVAERMIVITLDMTEDGETPDVEDPEVDVEIEGKLEFNGREFVLEGKELKGLERAEFIRSKIEELKAGLKVEVEGVEVDGEIEVSKVKVDRVSRITVVGSLEAVDAEAGTVTVAGETFVVTDDTDYEDNSDNEERQFDLSDLTEGDKLQVKGFIDDEGVNVAKRLKRLGDDMEEMSRYGKLKTTIASVADGMLVTTSGLEVVINEDTRLHQEFDLATLVLGDEGTELFIIGVYANETQLIAKAVFPHIDDVDVEAPEVEKPEVEEPEVEEPQVEKPEVEKPEGEKPETERPQVEKPEVEVPETQEPKDPMEEMDRSFNRGVISAIDADANSVTVGKMTYALAEGAVVIDLATETEITLADLMAGDFVVVRYNKDADGNATADRVKRYPERQIKQ